MSLRKRCGRGDPLPNGETRPPCDRSPRCEHFWYYDFRVNGRRYRASTETVDKQRARDIEAKERARILEGRHGIRRQPDITFKTFAATYLQDHSEVNKRSADRDAEIVKVLNRWFGSAILHEITAHRIEQFKRERLAGRWSAHGQKRAPKPVRPGTVNRELDTLRSIFSKAVEWGKLRESPMVRVKRLRVENRRTRILSEDEQRRLLEACPRKLRAIVLLALVSGARIGEVLGLRWDHCENGYMTFLETKNGKARQIPITPAIAAVLAAQPRVHPWVFTNAHREKPFTVNGVAHVFARAIARAGIGTGDVTLHTLRHTALSRMIAAGLDDYTVMEISGHSSTRMLGRYTHPTEQRKGAALETFSSDVVSHWAPIAGGADPAGDPDAEIAKLLREIGGRQEARTPDLRVANAALSQLS